MVEEGQRLAYDKLMALVQAPDFPGKLIDEHVKQFSSKIAAFSELELLAVTEKVTEEIDKKRGTGKTILVSKLEDVAALTKLEVMLSGNHVSKTVTNMLLLSLVNKSSNFGQPVFEGKVDELFEDSIENAIINVVLEKAAASTKGKPSEKSGGSKELKELFDRKIRDTETFIHLVQIIDNVDLNETAPVKSVFTINLLAEAMKRDETMRKSESIGMKDLINIFLLSKLQMMMAEIGYPNDTLEGIIINRLSQSNNIRRQFRILEYIIQSAQSGDLNIEMGSKTEKLEWLQLINQLEIDISLAQYEEKLAQDGTVKLPDDTKEAVRHTLMTDNIADQTIAAISFARRLDNPDESLHEPGKLAEVAAETQYLTSMIFKVKGFQIKEVYEFVELIGELDVKNSRYEQVIENFKSELPCIDKAVMKEEDPDIKKAALAARYLSARLMSKFDIDPVYLKMNPEYITLDDSKLPADLRPREAELEKKISDFNEIRKRLGFFNKAERAFLTMNQVETLIDKEAIKLDTPGAFRIMEAINDVELGLAVQEYVKAGTITRGQDDGAHFTAPYAESKIKALFAVDMVRRIEKEAVQKNIIPESVLEKAEEDDNFEETFLDIKNYATYLITRRLDKPEYPRHLQRAVNLIFALIQDAIGWRHFENSQIRAKREVVPLIEEYHKFLSRILDALAEDKDPKHEEVISKLRDDDFFAVNDNKDSLEGGKKSAPQVKAEFFALMNDDRFQKYTALALGFAETSQVPEWTAYQAELVRLKTDLITHIQKTCTVMDTILMKLKNNKETASRHKDHIQTLQNRYYDALKQLEAQLQSNRKPSTVVKIEFNRVVNSEKFKVFLKHLYELTKSLD
jgi:hypothetical protein